MLEIVRGEQGRQNRVLLEKVWRFRHRCFVEELGWEELRRADGRERDQFDTAATIHLVLTEKGEVAGYSRLLPTTTPHLLSHIFPQLVTKRPYPKGEHVFEWGRCGTDKGVNQIRGVATADLLMTGVLEFLVSAEIETVIIETNLRLVDMLKRRGYPMDLLGEPMVYRGETLIAVAAYPSPQLLEQHREAYSIDGSLLSFPPGKWPAIATARTNLHSQEGCGI
ncbi:acyl-homoserine-lactone synthase [Rhizobium terrae]|uniref:acyl-homoserine-lactone synthase n=1 Tax=Rhizobium terrae TaxID=2171756 RepID=UPI000E3C7F29|nr:acyl-homoserine-lactone synthase [Rhizobium terrae]